MRRLFFVLLMSVAASSLFAQFDPEDSQVNLYFPQLADGGPASQGWRTSFIFFNPDLTTTANGTLYFYDDVGNPLALDFGSGPNSTLQFSVPAQGTTTFQSTGIFPSVVTGWAFAAATLPLQSTELFKSSVNGTRAVELSAVATVPSSIYRSPANRQLGVAIANVYSQETLSVQLTAIDASGNQVAVVPLHVGPHNHASFNLFQLIPSLADNFSGSIKISAVNPSDQFVAWTLNADSSGTLSSLPPGRLEWPISHWDRIWLVFNKVLNAAQNIQSSLGVDLTTSPPQLQILGDPVINATGGYYGVTVYYALSELISDSPSELAFIVGHELGHVIQGRLAGLGGVLVPVLPPVSSEFAGIETDADQFGLTLSMLAGYDPYAGAGALAKVAMVTGTAGLEAQSTIDYEFANGQSGSDPHPSWGTRIDLMFQLLTTTCSNPQYSSTCNLYKSVAHPNFPPSAPLSVGTSRPAAKSRSISHRALHPAEQDRLPAQSPTVADR